VRRLIALVLIAGGASFPAVARAQAPPQPGERDQIVLSGDVTVPAGRAVGEVVVFDGTVTVDGVVRGDIVVLSGSVRVAGQVGGTVVVVDGSVFVEATGQIGEDVLAGDDVTLEPGAMVRGEARRSFRLSLARPLEVLGVLLAAAAVAFSSLLLGLVLLLVAPSGADRTADALRTAPWASAAWGIGLWLLLPVASVVAVASVVGIPVGLSILLGLGLVASVGYTLSVWSVGRWIVPAPRPRLGAFLAGWGISVVLSLVPFLHIAWWGLATILGLGGATVAAWRSRGSDRRGRHRSGSGVRPWQRLGTVGDNPAQEGAPEHRGA
jgi:hypothetical protein